MIAYSTMHPGDVTFLDTVESYLKKVGLPANVSPQEKLVIYDQYRDSLYSYDVQCLPRVADKIINSDLDVDNEARALWVAFSHHVMDPIFTSFMMQYLNSRQDYNLNGQIGSLISNVLNKYVEEHTEKDAKKKDKKEESSVPNFEEIRHLEIALEDLLGANAMKIQVRCVNLTHPEALFIASCLAMNNKNTLKELINSDLSITADIFDLLLDPDNIIKASLTLLKADVPSKLTTNQTAFLESLKRWLFDKLDMIPGGKVTLYQYLVGTYGSVKPDVSPYYIQIKDCGGSKPNLLEVAKQIVNK